MSEIICILYDTLITNRLYQSVRLHFILDFLSFLYLLNNNSIYPITEWLFISITKLLTETWYSDTAISNWLVLETNNTPHYRIHIMKLQQKDCLQILIKEFSLSRITSLVFHRVLMNSFLVRQDSGEHISISPLHLRLTNSNLS